MLYFYLVEEILRRRYLVVVQTGGGQICYRSPQKTRRMNFHTMKKYSTQGFDIIFQNQCIAFGVKIKYFKFIQWKKKKIYCMQEIRNLRGGGVILIFLFKKSECVQKNFGVFYNFFGFGQKKLGGLNFFLGGPEGQREALKKLHPMAQNRSQIQRSTHTDMATL